VTSNSAKCRKAASGPPCLPHHPPGQPRVMRVPLSPQIAALNDDHADPTGWVLQDIRAPGTRIVWLVQFDVSLNPIVWFPLPLPEAGSIEGVTAQVIGQAMGTLPVGMPLLELIEMPVLVGNYTAYQQVDPSNDLDAYGALHTIALTAANFGGHPLPIRPDAAYWIRLTGETGANSQSSRFKLFAADVILNP